MKTKKYLVKIDSTHGATVHIGINSDNVKPVFVYYCGRDTGRRYVNIGSAARVLEKIAVQWGGDTVKTYDTAAAIPVHGSSPWNNALVKHQYAGAAFPDPKAYYPGI